MANINLPKTFTEKISGNQELDGIVKTTVSDFGEILKKDNTLYFFPEYTEHGVEHIENVLTCSDKFIPKKTLDILGPEDIANYILSVILHDIGMHLTLEGFNQLLAGDYNKFRVEFFDDLTWSELWQDFFSEAQRFGGRQLLSIFGDPDTIIRTPPRNNRGEMTENDRKLIGEFIRRNHPRLAHEIALNGFPGLKKLSFAERISPQVRNLIGLIARSHGIDLRKSVDYISVLYKSAVRNPHNCHAVYLMTLLRISDYVQIDKSRSSQIVLNTKRLMSPVSNMEHEAHKAIDFLEFDYQDDPERIFVNATPESSSMFLKLKKLFNNIQYEFDISWAVLGQVYGNIENKPDLKYRRIESNISDNNFKSALDFVADEFRFKANDDIVRLLIAPLYGDDPKYGVRELLQNSIDACSERAKLEGNDYTPKVSVQVLNEDNPYFLISDNGKGMGAIELKEYFLSAGASYRKSYEWKKNYQDDDGNVLIKRNGRFGIGVLAAFLLGDSIEVRTKKIGEKTGYSFKADLYTDQIDMIKETNLETGTEIKINLPDLTLNRLANTLHHRWRSHYLSWIDWYTFQSPTIQYQFFDQKLTPNEEFNPDIHDSRPIDWGEISTNGFERILWTYTKRVYNDGIICNGIVIPDSDFRGSSVKADLGLIMRSPKVNIFDLQGQFPLSLNRNEVIDIIPFEKDLKIDIYRDLIARILCLKNLTEVRDNMILNFNNDINHPGTSYREGMDYGFEIFGSRPSYDGGKINFGHNLDNLLFSKKGYIPTYCYFANKIGDFHLILINCTSRVDSFEVDIKDSFVRLSTKKLNSIEDLKSAIDSRYFKAEDHSLVFSDSRAYIRKERYDFLYDTNKRRISDWMRELTSVKSQNKNWVEIELGNPKPSIINESFTTKYKPKGLNFVRENIVLCPNEGDLEFNKLLEVYLGNDVIIPYNIEDRKKKYPKAFEELSDFMEKHL